MYIELEPIFNNDGASLEINQKLDFSELEFNSGKPFISPVSVKGEVKNNTGVVSISAKVDFDLPYACDRCAADSVFKGSFPIEHIIVTELHNKDEDEFLVLPNMRLNLDELVREEILLYLPSKILCNEGCKGLCPMCGKNLNNGPCSCEKPIDPRLEALRQLLDN